MRLAPAFARLVPAVLIVAWGFLGLPESARAEIVLEVDVGFGGAVPLGLPGLLSVRVENRTVAPFRGELAVQSSDLFSAGGARIRRLVEVSPGAARQVFLLIEGRPGVMPLSLVVSSSERHDFRASVDGVEADPVRDRGQIEVELGDISFFETPRNILVLGPKGRQAAKGVPVTDPNDDKARLKVGGEGATLVWLDAHLAPDTVLAYAGIDEILWTEPDPSVMEGPGQLRALLEWVTEGGRLTLLGATRPSLLDAPELKRLLPLDDIEVEVGSYPAPVGAVGEGLALFGPRLTGMKVGGATEVPRMKRTSVRSEGGKDLPVPVARWFGLGQVVLARFDPFVYDIGSARVLAHLIGAASGIDLHYFPDPTLRDSAPRPFLGTPDYDPLGGTDFARVLCNENALTPSFGLFFFLAFWFVLLIGPIDYSLLKRRGRLHWSPWTLLAYTVTFSAASLGATYLLFAPDEEMNRIAFLDLTEGPDGAERVNGVVYHGAYSPSSGDFAPRMRGVQSFGVEVPTDSRRGFWGGDGRATAGQLFLGPGMQPLDMQVPFNSQRVSAHLISGSSTGGVSVSRETQDGAPMITIYNGLGSALTDAIVYSQRGILKVGKVERGETIHLPEDHLRDLTPGLTPASALDFNAVGRVEGPLSETWARSLMVRSVLESLSISKSNRAAYERGDAIFMAQTDALPFDDGLSERRAGYQWIFVHKVVADAGGS